MQLNPKPVRGSWDDGCTLDMHIRSSEFVGYNEYGHAQFESARTELGELLYRLKYKGDRSSIAPIAQAAFDFVCGWNPGIDVVVPTPPSKSRAVQPLFQIADELGRLLGLPVDTTSVRKTKATPGAQERRLRKASRAAWRSTLHRGRCLEGPARPSSR